MLKFQIGWQHLAYLCKQGLRQLVHDMVISGCSSEEPLWLSLAAIGPCMSPSHLETGLLGLRAEWVGGPWC